MSNTSRSHRQPGGGSQCSGRWCVQWVLSKNRRVRHPRIRGTAVESSAGREPSAFEVQRPNCPAIPCVRLLPCSDRFRCEYAENSRRIEFEQEGLTTARERLARLDALVVAERSNLTNLQEQKAVSERDIASLESVVENHKEELATLQEALDEKSKVVDQVKKAALKSSKVLDQALKEIAACVSGGNFNKYKVY